MGTVMLWFNSMGFEVRQYSLKRFNQFGHESAQNHDLAEFWIIHFAPRTELSRQLQILNREFTHETRLWQILSFVHITEPQSCMVLLPMSQTSTILLVQGTGNTTDLRFCLWKTTTRRSFTGLHHHNNFAPLASTKKSSHTKATQERPTTQSLSASFLFKT